MARLLLVFDDETVAEFPADRIKELHGGGDFHMAYMCFYRKMDGLRLGAAGSGARAGRARVF